MVIGSLTPPELNPERILDAEYLPLKVDLSDALDDGVRMHAPLPFPVTSGIGPGHHLIIEMNGGTFGCTSSFVYTNGTTMYLAAAGHCFLPEGKTATHGPNNDWAASNTKVYICKFQCFFGGQTGFIVTGSLIELGPVAYARQTGSGGDVGNDFGIVTIPEDLEFAVSNSVPMWGGPTQYGTLQSTEPVCHYGFGVAVGETFLTMGRMGVGMGSNADSWFANTPSAPGDSGSAVVTCGQEGTSGWHGIQAVGTLTHLVINTGVVAGTTQLQGIDMASDDAGIDLTLEFE